MDGDSSSDVIHDVRPVASSFSNAVDVDLLAPAAALVVSLERDDVR